MDFLFPELSSVNNKIGGMEDCSMNIITAGFGRYLSNTGYDNTFPRRVPVGLALSSVFGSEDKLASMLLQYVSDRRLTLIPPTKLCLLKCTKRNITSSPGKPNCSTFTLQNTSNHDFSRRDPVRYPCRHQRDDDPELFPSRRLGTVQCTRDYPIRTNDCRLIHVYRSAGDGPWHPDHNTIYE